MVTALTMLVLMLVLVMIMVTGASVVTDLTFKE